MKKASFLCYFLLCMLLLSCSRPSLLEQTLLIAEENRVELEKVLDHYKKNEDKRKYEAAQFLISNMGNKFGYEGEILEKYRPVFEVHDSLYNISDSLLKLYQKDTLLLEKGTFKRNHEAIETVWNKLTQKYGLISHSKLTHIYDCKVLSANFLIQNIENAFLAWEASPTYNPDDFELFCEYILPHRITNESPEVYREKYYTQFKHILDTATNIPSIINGFRNELYNNLKYRHSQILWDYSAGISISQMEKIHSGACKHMTSFQALVMKACGLPVTIDRAIWGNRSIGHSWNVFIEDSKNFFPFDALEKDSIKLAYKPAKIFRKRYSIDIEMLDVLNTTDVPEAFFVLDEKDVTDQYVKAFDISIPIKYEYNGERKKKIGVICVFDNKNWRVVYWGEIKSKKFHFNKMASGILYVGAYYENGDIIPATDPFLLREDGTVDYCVPNENDLIDMKLERKYPLMRGIRMKAFGIVGMLAEGANNSMFNNPTTFFTQSVRSYNVMDSLINSSTRFKYVRLNIAKNRDANLAEVEFYGKEMQDGEEKKLEGKVIGYPPSEEWSNPYQNAMDGNLETFFEKDKKREGWVGLELDKPCYITRVRFAPRSDTNFILEGDTYELKYWGDTQWVSAGIKVAEQYNYINFKNIPSGAIYLLSNLSRGKEERIFTYENGVQVWW